MSKKTVASLLFAFFVCALAMAPPAQALCGDCYYGYYGWICVAQDPGYRICYVVQCPPPFPEGAECCYTGQPCIYA